MYPDVSFPQESFDGQLKAKDDAHKVALEEMKAKADKTVGDLKEELEELEEMHQSEVVVYFICGAYVSLCMSCLIFSWRRRKRRLNWYLKG
jgi:hypothetical protein